MKTATQWLFEQLWETPKDKFNWYAILEQAKAMEKAQIVDAHNQGYADGYRDNGNSPIEYYQQTFKNK
jgi:hypothetical protein